MKNPNETISLDEIIRSAAAADGTAPLQHFRIVAEGLRDLSREVAALRRSVDRLGGRQQPKDGG